MFIIVSQTVVMIRNGAERDLEDVDSYLLLGMQPSRPTQHQPFFFTSPRLSCK